MLTFRLTILLSFFLAQICLAQQNNTWYFGRNAGIDFTPIQPVPLHNSAMIADEVSSTICDKNGNLLFYTNGVTIYNKDHAVMQNGNNLAGNISSVQGALIVPQPGSTTLFYVFTGDAIENNFSRGYTYSIVDMSLDNGKGAVTAKNNILQSSCTERLTAVRHADGNSVWVITNDHNSNIFKSWLVDCNGLNTNPVISTTGVVLNQHILSNNGMMKVSPDGKTLCQTHFPIFDDGVTYPNFFQLFDFNSQTGVISNPRTINPGDAGMTSCEFSPNSKILYVTRSTEKKMDQFDLSLGSPTAIIASRFSIPGVTVPYYGIQLAPDSKIYLCSPSQLLGIIHNPNARGAACTYQKDGLDVYEQISGLPYAGLPNFINDLSYDGANNIDYNIVDSCTGVVQFFAVTSMSGNISYDWDFGDGQTSTLQNPVHTFNGTASSFQVKLTIRSTSACGNIVRTKTVIPKGLLLLAGFIPTVVCDSGYVRFRNTTTFLPDTAQIQYTWDFGDGNSSTLIHPMHSFAPGTYNVKLTVKTSTPCFDQVVTRQVIMQSFSIQAGTATEIDQGQTAPLTATGPGILFAWTPTTGLSNPTIANPVAKPRKTTMYYVTATNAAGCKDIDSVLIKVRPIPGVKVPTGFTPNNDGKNDIMRPYINDDLTLDEFSIFNRWGQKVYSTSVKEAGWNGKINGLLQNPGVFVWMIRVTDHNGIKEELKGSFVLIR